MLGHERFFRPDGAAVNAAPVFVLRRPSEGWTLDRVLDLIEQSRRNFGRPGTVCSEHQLRHPGQRICVDEYGQRPAVR